MITMVIIDNSHGSYESILSVYTNDDWGAIAPESLKLSTVSAVHRPSNRPTDSGEDDGPIQRRLLRPRPMFDREFLREHWSNTERGLHLPHESTHLEATEHMPSMFPLLAYPTRMISQSVEIFTFIIHCSRNPTRSSECFNCIQVQTHLSLSVHNWDRICSIANDEMFWILRQNMNWIHCCALQ